VRSHHYLTLNLARSRATDAAKDMTPNSQGWIYAEALANAIGIDLRHLNIRVHRARVQLAAAFDNNKDKVELIERRAGQIRFSPNWFEVYKDGRLEIALYGKSMS
jgi:hypothetical protein